MQLQNFYKTARPLQIRSLSTASIATSTSAPKHWAVFIIALGNTPHFCYSNFSVSGERYRCAVSCGVIVLANDSQSEVSHWSEWTCCTCAYIRRSSKLLRQQICISCYSVLKVLCCKNEVCLGNQKYSLWALLDILGKACDQSKVAKYKKVNSVKIKVRNSSVLCCDAMR